MNLRLTVVAGAITLFGSLVLARVHPFGDAGLYVAASPPQKSSIPSPAAAIFTKKCADCHSSQTRVPIYGRLAPISWLMERDILEGRKRLNLSAWDSYPPEKRQVLQAKIIQETKANRMPLAQYRAIHWGSAITPADLNTLTEWAHAAIPAEDSSTLSEGSAAAGKIIFEKRCTGCHSLAQNREGPNLRGVFGRSAGRVEGFTYSDALRNSHIVWSEAALDRWLTEPDAFLPGNNMDFSVAKAQERSDLIRFLKEQVDR